MTQEDLLEEGTQGLHYVQLEPFEDEPLEEGGASELEGLYTQAKALCDGFLGPFKVRLGQHAAVETLTLPRSPLVIPTRTPFFRLFAAQRAVMLCTRQ